LGALGVFELVDLSVLGLDVGDRLCDFSFSLLRQFRSHIDECVVEAHADPALGTFNTQREAIDWAKSKG
jgi:hypothetical protein